MKLVFYLQLNRSYRSNVPNSHFVFCADNKVSFNSIQNRSTFKLVTPTFNTGIRSLQVTSVVRMTWLNVVRNEGSDWDVATTPC